MKEAGAAVVERTPDELLERAKKGIRPLRLDPVGECPYCHNGRLERHSVTQQLDISSMAIGSPPHPGFVVLAYWACMNEACCLMFWRFPRVPVLRRHDGSTPRGIKH